MQQDPRHQKSLEHATHFLASALGYLVPNLAPVSCTPNDDIIFFPPLQWLCTHLAFLACATWDKRKKARSPVQPVSVHPPPSTSPVRIAPKPSTTPFSFPKKKRSFTQPNRAEFEPSSPTLSHLTREKDSRKKSKAKSQCLGRVIIPHRNQQTKLVSSKSPPVLSQYSAYTTTRTPPTHHPSRNSGALIKQTLKSRWVDSSKQKPF